MADPLPQILDGVQQNFVEKQIGDVPVSKILVVPVATVRVDVHFPVPQILEQSVEVIEVILQEQFVLDLFSNFRCAPIAHDADHVLRRSEPVFWKRSSLAEWVFAAMREMSTKPGNMRGQYGTRRRPPRG